MRRAWKLLSGRRCPRELCECPYHLISLVHKRSKSCSQPKKMAIPVLQGPVHREPVASRNPAASQAAAIAHIACKLRASFELVASQIHSSRVEVNDVFAAFLTSQIRRRRTRNRGRVTAAVLITALLETFDITTHDGRRYLSLKPPHREDSGAVAEDVVDANQVSHRPRGRPRRRRRVTQKRLPRNRDAAMRVTECYRGELGFTFFNFHRKEDEDKLRFIVQHLNSVKLKECHQYSKGFLCVAVHSEINGDVLNEQFLRAVVLGRGRDETLVRVRFIDFNFENEVEKDSLCHLPRRLRRIPPLAYSAVLVNTDRRDREARELQASRIMDSDETTVRVLKYHKKRNLYEVYVYHPNERHVDDAGFQVG